MKQRTALSLKAIVATLGALAASNAMAATKLGNIITTASTSTVTGPTLVLSAVSFLIGAGLIVSALFKLPSVMDGQAQLRDPMWRVGGGACMIALPWFVGAAINTIFGAPADGSEGTYTNLSAGDCTKGLDQCMMAFVQNIYQPVQVLINVACYMLGAICVGIGVYRMALFGQTAGGQAPKAGGTLGYMGGGALLISLGQFMDTIRDSIFGSANTSTVFTTLSYGGQSSLPAALQADASNVFMALFAWVQLVGYMAFARGVYLLIKIANGDGSKSHGQAFTHIIGGALAVNMYPLISIVQSTLNISLVT